MTLEEDLNWSWYWSSKLWKQLSEMPNREIENDAEVFKNSILTKLGLTKDIMCGCPFCEKFYRSSNCPLGNCEYELVCLRNTPYKKWHECLIDRGYHNQKAAKEFYKYLLKVKEEDNKQTTPELGFA